MAILYELLTADVTFLSKYFSKANDNINNENNAINIEGIKVNKAKNVIYFLFAFDPLTSTSTLREALISLFSLFLLSFALDKYFDKKITTAVNNSYEIAKSYTEEVKKKPNLKS